MRFRFDKLIKPDVDYLKEICNFTDEELLIIENLRNNKSNEEIARKMGYSSRTVDRRISEIKKKVEKARNI